MARCKLTKMNLRNIRKTREYQCLLIDLVKAGVVGKSAAEGLLGYTIPEGLLDGVSSEPTEPTEPTDPEEDDTPRTVTIVYNSEPSEVEELDVPLTSFEYDLNNGDSDADILAAAREEFNDDTLNNVAPVHLTPDYGKGDQSTEAIAYSVLYINEVSAYEAGMTLLVGAYVNDLNPPKD